MNNLKGQFKILFFLTFIIITISSCAPSGHTSKEYGFFSGVLHGFLLTFSLIAKLFGMDYGIYAENNTGFTYWLGFVLAILFLGGSGYSSRRR